MVPQDFQSRIIDLIDADPSLRPHILAKRFGHLFDLPSPIHKQAIATTVSPASGYTLATSLAFVRQDQWSNRHCLLRSLMSRGVDINVPDEKGRLPFLQVLANSGANLTVEDLAMAFRQGLHALQFEDNPAPRSLLSLSFGDKPSARVMGVLHRHMDRFFKGQAPANRIEGMDLLSKAPIDEAHASWWSELLAKTLAECAPQHLSSKAPARRL